jgi:hypothetical protein
MPLGEPGLQYKGYTEQIGVFDAERSTFLLEKHIRVRGRRFGHWCSVSRPFHASRQPGSEAADWQICHGTTACELKRTPPTTSTSGSVSSGHGSPELALKSAASLRTDRQSAVETSHVDPQSASLTLEYDSLNERFYAVSQSFTQRASDPGNLPLKPEVAAALGTARADLAAIKQALHDRNWNVATQRIGRVKKTLSYLESLSEGT